MQRQVRKRDKTHKMREFEVMFTPDGDLSLSSKVYHYGSGKSACFTEKNSVFPDELEYYNYFGASGGNSYMEFISLKTGRKYHMFMSDFDDVLLEKRFQDNKIVGLFFFCRKGSRQGIRLFLDPVVP